MRILITGGTGTIGKLLCEDMALERHELVVFSRDEYKQSMLKFPCTKIIGDVRNIQRMRKSGSLSLIIHTAALKHVDIAEENLRENFEINVGGTNACIKLAKENDCPIIFLSTDKAVYPINAYGMAKAMAEKLVLEYEKGFVVRYGNVLNSRGSIIEKIYSSLENGIGAKITHKDMTRFWIKQSDVVDFISALPKVPGLYIPHIKCAPLEMLVDCVEEVYQSLTGHHIPKREYIGMRPGEKLHEALFHRHENVLGDLWGGVDELYSNNAPKNYMYTKEALMADVREQLKLSGLIK